MLITDCGDETLLNEFAESFDQAVDQWRQFWELPEGSLAQWRVSAFVMRDKNRFRAAGHLPSHVPDFAFGYAAGSTVWVTEQKSEYYTRHLLLHEGVHALMFSQFGGAGPSWFMEGTAELLAVHAGKSDQLIVNRVPANRQSVPYWGRFKLLSQRRDEGRVPTLQSVMRFPRELNADVESYGWSWAAVMLLSRYADTAPTFQSAARNGRDSSPKFNLQLQRELRNQWPLLCARWRLLCQSMDYGFDWESERVDLSMRDPMWDQSARTVSIASDRGWQSIGVRLQPGMRLKLTPSGRCELAAKPKPWISEPNGITVRYYRGRPLGQLIGMLVPNVPETTERLKPFDVFSVGAATEISVKQHSWLVLRVNDAIGELDDNQGAYRVEISRQR